MRRFRALWAVVLLAPAGCFVVGANYFTHEPLTDEIGPCVGFQLSSNFVDLSRETPSTRILPEAMLAFRSPFDVIDYSIGANVEFDNSYVGAGLCLVTSEHSEGVAEPVSSSLGGYVCWGLREADMPEQTGLLVRYVFGTELEAFGEREDGNSLQIMLTVSVLP